MVAIGAGSAASNKAAAPKAGGTVTFAAEQIPPCLNGVLSGCNNTWTSWTAGIAFRALYIVKPNFSIVPDLAAGPAQLISRKPETLLVKISPKANWSDGKPITVDDLIFTWKTYVNPKWDIASRSGFDSVKSITKVGNNKTAKIVFAKPYAPWKVMLQDSLLPAHALAGADFNNVWNDNNNDPHTGKPIASGPFILSNYTQGQSITMVRNPNGWPHPSKLDKIVFVFRTNTDSEIQALRGGEVDAIYPQAQLQLADLKSQPGLAYQTNAGTTLEHLDLNVDPKGSKSNPLMNQVWFRQMIAYGMDRSAAVKQLYRTLNPKLTALNNLTYPNTAPEYKADFAGYTYQPSKVAAIAKAHGCTHTIVYTRENFVERVKELTGGKGVPVVYDGVGKAMFPASLDCLVPRGLYVNFGNASGPVPPFDMLMLSQKGSLYVTRPTLVTFTSTRPALLAMADEMFGLVKAGKIVNEARQTYALKDAAQAHRDLEARKTTGSTLLLP